ncbi:MAG: tetratricopeptide repeat protein [SAR202 cluster bacterium]|nr:tetratricopeptide repeat protein [SAR202 cluster bacterium]
MDSEATQTPGSAKLKRDLSREAVNHAIQGDWERATEVNKATLELFPNDVEAMNRLVKALIELGSYVDARAVLDRVCEVAPYNNIAKKNRARLDQLVVTPGAAKQTRKAAGAPQIFIEESGKSGTTVLRNISGGKSFAHISPSDQVTVSSDGGAVFVRTMDGQLVGQVEPKLGNRLARLMDGGNKYTAAVVAVNEEGVSVIIRETFKHRSLQNVCSFHAKVKEADKVFMNETVARFVREVDEESDDSDGDQEDDDDDDDEKSLIVEDEIEASWSENE